MNISVTLSPELRLEQALKQAGVEDLAAVTKLSISGTITGDDFRYFLNTMRDTLQELDMPSLQDTHSVETLEEFANLVCEDEVKDYWNGFLFGYLMRHRKEKLNQQFTFNKDNIEAIVRIDKYFKESCQKLKEEAERESNRLFDRLKANEIRTFTLYGSIIPCIDNYLLNNIPCEQRKETLTFQMNTPVEKDMENSVSIFDITTNYADKIDMFNNELSGRHIGYAVYKLYSDSCFSLQDIIKISDIESEILSQQEFYSLKFSPEFSTSSIFNS